MRLISLKLNENSLKTTYKFKLLLHFKNVEINYKISTSYIIVCKMTI